MGGLTGRAILASDINVLLMLRRDEPSRVAEPLLPERVTDASASPTNLQRLVRFAARSSVRGRHVDHTARCRPSCRAGSAGKEETSGDREQTWFRYPKPKVPTQNGGIASPAHHFISYLSSATDSHHHWKTRTDRSGLSIPTRMLHTPFRVHRFR